VRRILVIEAVEVQFLVRYLGEITWLETAAWRVERPRGSIHRVGENQRKK